jgi:hypothetical protein
VRFWMNPGVAVNTQRGAPPEYLQHPAEQPEDCSTFASSTKAARGFEGQHAGHMRRSPQDPLTPVTRRDRPPHIEVKPLCLIGCRVGRRFNAPSWGVVNRYPLRHLASSGERMFQPTECE